MRLSPISVDPDRFSPYGQVIFAIPDGVTANHQDAQLVLDQGVPRFYLMRLTHQKMRFQRITQHRLCTQCLGSLGGKDWYLGVASSKVLATDLQPDKIEVFHIPGNCFVKLGVGTWHAGPYFVHPYVDFYNLELQNTNVTDHHSILLAHPIVIDPR